jgi:hypothetical protein
VRVEPRRAPEVRHVDRAADVAVILLEGSTRARCAGGCRKAPERHKRSEADKVSRPEAGTETLTYATEDHDELSASLTSD